MTSPTWVRAVKWAALVLLAVVAVLLPAFVSDPATVNIAVFTVMYVGLATAWNIMGGYTGYVSLGHAAFFGFGAYAFGLVLAHLGIQAGYEPFLFVPVAGALTIVLALVVGWIALSTRAATFVIVTIAMMAGKIERTAQNAVPAARIARFRSTICSRTRPATARQFGAAPFG